MSENPEFRDDVREVVKRHNPDAEELRTLASDLETLADRWEDTDDVL